jgi:predicted AAA+ superfamily ATPase
MQMIVRHLQSILIHRLATVPVVALLGPRQVGKTTLAKSLELSKRCHYLDLERPSDLAKLADPELYLSSYSDQLVILDEIQRVPELFPVLRSLVDERRQRGESAGYFLLLGSASPDLLRQSSETLAGRITYLEMTPFQMNEVNSAVDAQNRHWFRGGYPESYLAKSDDVSRQWRSDFITSYVERHLPQQGITASPIQLRRFCTMLAHEQAGTVNLASIGNALGIDGKTVQRYMDLLEGLFLIRRIPAWSRNTGKRLVKMPKVYWRDSGLLHELLGLNHLEHVLGHPVCGPSWEGYCVEQILNALPLGVVASHYRTHAGAEVDLVLEWPSGDIQAIEIKRTLSPKLTPALRESMETLSAVRGTILIPKGESFPLSDSVNVMTLQEYLKTHFNIQHSTFNIP